MQTHPIVRTVLELNLSKIDGIGGGGGGGESENFC